MMRVETESGMQSEKIAEDDEEEIEIDDEEEAVQTI
jgi:hypothetical protein